MAHTIEEMEDYYQLLEALYSDGSYRTTANEDRAHNTTMLRFMLDKSNTLNMYCGEMSVFRKDFYLEIDKESRANVDIGNALTFPGSELKEMLIDSLHNFINRGNTILNIIMEKFSPEFFNDLIDRNLFKLGIDRKAITLRKINPNRIQTHFMSHFTVTEDKTLRMETDMINHKGLCGFHIEEDLYTDLNKTFNILEVASTEIKTSSI